MPLSWNEIKTRAIAFTNEWKDEVSEDAEAKSFWDDFFNVFGIRRPRVATIEHHLKQLNNKDGFIDLFWPGTLIVEQTQYSQFTFMNFKNHFFFLKILQ